MISFKKKKMELFLHIFQNFYARCPLPQRVLKIFWELFLVLVEKTVVLFAVLDKEDEYKITPRKLKQ